MESTKTVDRGKRNSPKIERASEAMRVVLE